MCHDLGLNSEILPYERVKVLVILRIRMKEITMKLLKTFFLITSTISSLAIFSNTIEEAENLWEARGIDLKNAKRAEEIYAKLAEDALHKMEKENFLYKQTEVIYYIARNSEKERKVINEIYDRGIRIANGVIKMIGDDIRNDEEGEILASTYFFLAAHTGKRYEESSGPIKALHAREIKKMMTKVIEEFGYGDVHEYGPHRVLGRTLIKLPGILGGNVKKGIEELRTAFSKSKEESTGVSVHGLNNIFLVEALRVVDLENKNDNNKAEYCSILKKFSEQDDDLILDTRIPETRKEMKYAENKKKEFNCNDKN